MGKWDNYRSYSASGGVARHSRGLDPAEHQRHFSAELEPAPVPKASRSPRQRKPPRGEKQPMQPLDVMVPTEDSEQLRSQVGSLMEVVIGSAALSPELDEAFRDDERRSVLIQRVGNALRSYGLSEAEFFESAQHLADLSAPYETPASA